MKTRHLLLLSTILFLAASCGNNNKQNGQQEQSIVEKEKTFQKTDIKELDFNAVSLIADNWFVVTAGNESSYNQMTISWGAIGNVWGFPAATIYIRDSRHTYPFIENNKYFTLCAFPEEYRDKVLFIGSNSGRDMNKIEATGLTPKVTELGNIYYDEAHLVLECEKIYFNDIQPQNLTDPKGLGMYQKEEAMHRMYIGKIVNVWEKK